MSQPAVEFDPYRKWLGISPQEQPAHYYRLLGIAPFEADPDVIENAADRQMSHVRTFQAGKFGKYTQGVLNELAAAKVCLLSPDRKAQYDQELTEKLQAEERLKEEAGQAEHGQSSEPPMPPPVAGHAPIAPPELEAPPVAIPIAYPVAPAPLFQPTVAPAPVFNTSPTYEAPAFSAPVREAPAFHTAPSAMPIDAAPVAPATVPLSVPHTAAPRVAPVNLRPTAAVPRVRRGNSNQQFPIAWIAGGGIAIVLLVIIGIAMNSGSGKSHDKPGDSKLTDNKPGDSKPGEKPSGKLPPKETKRPDPVRPDPTKPDPVKPPTKPEVVATLPPFDPSKPLEPSRAEKLKEALASARRAISNRDLLLAKTSIQHADSLKQDASESADVEHLRSLMISIERVLEKAAASAKTLKVGDELKVGNNRYSIKVTAIDGDVLSIETGGGKSIKHRATQMPAVHLLAIAYNNQPLTDPRFAADAAAFLILDHEDQKRDSHLKMAKNHYDEAVKAGLTDEAVRKELARIPPDKLASKDDPKVDPPKDPLVPEKPLPEKPASEKPPQEIPAAKRNPLPSAELLADARKRSAEILKDVLARARTLESKQQLADDLVKQAAADADLAMRYVTLEKARDLMLGTSSLDIARAVAATEALAANFDADRFGELQMTLARAATIATGKPELGEIYKLATKGVESAMELRRYDAAASLARVGLRAAKKANATEYIKPAEALADRLDRAANEQKRYESAKLALEKNPEDAPAHAAVGNFLAFFAGDFAGGLPHLLKSDNNELRLLAAADLENPTEPAKQFALATEWHAQARRTTGPASLQMFKRAGYWAEKALPGLEGASKEKADLMVMEAAALSSDLTKP